MPKPIRAVRYAAAFTPRHPAALAACGWMALSAGLRLTYFLGGGRCGPLWLHLVLPVAAALLFLLGHILGPRPTKVCSSAAVVLGVLFFVLKAADFAPLHRALCTLLYLAVLMLYLLTALGALPTRRLLFPLFGLPLLYHIFVEDTQTYFFADPPVPVFDWLPELSVLCIMAALFCQAFSIHIIPRQNPT